jgi:phage tail-like protein
MAERKHDHFGGFNFKVEVEGVTQGAFKAIEGIGVEASVVEYKDGDDLTVRKHPGQVKFSNIVLKRGYTNTTELWKWRKAAMDGKIERKSGSIILMNDFGQEVCRFNFFEAWPCKWKGFTFDGKANDNAVEEITLALEYLKRG